MIRALEIDAHSTDPAIVLRYDMVQDNLVLKKNKIIQLKNLNEDLNCSNLAKSVVEQCPLIPRDRLADVEQIIYYLQKRLAAGGAAGDVGLVKAEIGKLDEYIEYLYEDADKLKASSLIFSLCSRPANLQVLAENDVLMGALSRVFREDSQQNFDLAINLALIFGQISKFTKFHPVLSKYKIGALSLQLIENEIKRSEQWRAQAKKAPNNERRKFELALRKQSNFMAECIKILFHLSNELRAEGKMVKRGLLPLLVRAVDLDPGLARVGLTFLWKLSVFQENKAAMAQLGVVEKVGGVLGAAREPDLLSVAFCLLFNLSFDAVLRQKMVDAGLVNVVAAHIQDSEVALGLLYQLSIVDDAKAMFTYTDSIPTLLEMLGSCADNLTVKAILVNVAMEKRNAQRIVGPDGNNLKGLMEQTMNNKDPLMIKIVRNISQHEGVTQAQLMKYLPDVYNTAKTPKLGSFATDSLAILSQITGKVEWAKVLGEADVLHFMTAILSHKSTQYYPDEYLLHLVAFAGTLASDAVMAVKLVELADEMLELLKKKQEEDEFCLQIAFFFHRLLTHTSVREDICKNRERVVEYIINMSHDKNKPLRDLCDKTLQIVSEVNDYWFKRISEERFCWYNSTWLDMVAQRSVVDDRAQVDEEDLFLEEQFRNAVLDAEEILE